MQHRDTGSTPFERLRSHMEHTDLVCPDCGYEDEGGEWKAVTSGDRILYRHLCPSCGSVRRRTFDLNERPSDETDVADRADETDVTDETNTTEEQSEADEAD